MLRIALLTLVAVAAAACSPSFTARVGTFSTPIANTLGTVCWVRVDTAGAPAIRTATFRAHATYEPAALSLTDDVRVQVFGRGTPPADECTSSDDADAVPLSEPFDLEHEESQPIEVGGEAYGGELAALVNGGELWVGASAAGNVGVGEERVEFRDGRITVGF